MTGDVTDAGRLFLRLQGWTTVLGCRSVDAAEQAASRLRKLDLPGSVKA